MSIPKCDQGLFQAFLDPLNGENTESWIDFLKPNLNQNLFILFYLKYNLSICANKDGKYNNKFFLCFFT